VQPHLISKKKTPDLMVRFGLETLRRERSIKAGQNVVIVTGSPTGKPGTANKIEIRKV
jgi:pyruvate kinase